MSYTVPALRYDYDALEPIIGAETLRLHHDGHHQVYVDALNETIAGVEHLQDRTIEDLLRHLDEVPDAIRPQVREYGGGHANHQLFWKIMAPPATSGGGLNGALADQIARDFGSFEVMKREFEEAGIRHIGSGWVYLAMDPKSLTLEILTLPGNDSVLFMGKPALFVNDLWEHAYYVQHRNRKADYLRSWWNVVNWPYVGERRQGIIEGRNQL